MSRSCYYSRLASTRWPSIRKASTLSCESQRFVEYRENIPTLLESYMTRILRIARINHDKRVQCGDIKM